MIFKNLMVFDRLIFEVEKEQNSSSYKFSFLGSEGFFDEIRQMKL